MDIFDKRLGERIKQMREDLGLSQEDLAENLGINRVSLSQIENGQREVGAEEVAKFSEVFNISSDILLDLKQSIEVVFEKKQKASTKQEDDMRISVPQKNIRKFKQVLLYILNKVGSKPNIGETVIYKLLYFIDFNFYEKYEEQLIGATYLKNRFGPTPIEFKKVVDGMIEHKEIMRVKDEYFMYPRTKYLPLKAPDLSPLKANEIKLIDEVLEDLSDMNARQISKYSHEDVPWLAAKDGGIIDYESVFYRTDDYSVRDYSGKDEETF